MFSFDIPMPDGSIYSVKGLLAKKENANFKIYKSNKAGKNIVTQSLSLAPAHASGFNLCTSASHACIKDCLFTAGYAMIHPRKIQPARIAKARFYKLFKAEFLNRLKKELDDSLKTANRKSIKLAIRLNVLSDIMWERETDIIQFFPKIQFYDYTKHYKRMIRYVNGDFPPNYHLTFSWSGTNKEQCEDILSKRGNVAVPFHIFRTKPLPQKFMDRKILDGDITDLRFLDRKGGYIVGLRAKGRARLDKSSGFVVSI